MLILGELTLFSSRLVGQITHETGDYKTISSGDYNDPGIWEVWDGSAWLPATEKPNQSNSIFLDLDHEVRLSAQESANHVYLFSAADPGRKLNLQTFELHVYGALRAMAKSGGDFVINNVTNAMIDWIYPETGSIVFKGASRTVVDRSSWSANTTNSRYTVVFDPEPAATLTVNSAFKANRFILQSGTVIQTVNTDGTAACSTFSFNNQMVFNGTGPYGELVIEPGATLVSECAAPFAQIIRRTMSIPAALLHLKTSGNLVLLGNNPTMDVAEFQFEGNVYYRSGSGNQHLIQTTMAISGNPNTYYNLLFENNASKTLSDSLFLKGDLAYLNGGPLLEAPTYLRFEGTGQQQVVNWEMDIGQIEIDKPSGTLFINADVRAKTHLFMHNGKVDFGGNDLYINTQGGGQLLYTAGSWLNLNRLIINNIPNTLTEQNSTFPFEDIFQGGVRKIQLLGNSPGGNLAIRYIESPGADWDPMFDDSDGTPILYQLYSYFEVTGTNSGTENIEFRISADNLIVDDVDDLRVVSNGQAAPGVHMAGLDPSVLWARRSLQFGDLEGSTFTVGSFREFSILPVQWLEFQAKTTENGITITWSTAKESNNEKFIVHRALGSIDFFEPIGEVPSKGDSEQVQDYAFHFAGYPGHQPVYFQLEQVDKNGESNFGKVFRLENYRPLDTGKFKIWPNPYRSGKINISAPESFNPITTKILVMSLQGKICFEGGFKDGSLEKQIENLPKGIFVLFIRDNQKQQIIRFQKD